MPWGFAAVAGATVGSALIGSSAANSAAQDQENAANNATQLQLAMFNTTQANLEPYNTTGQNALSQLASLYGIGGANGGPTGATATAATNALTNYPGYQFDLSQGELALQRSAAATSGNINGGALKDLMTYGEGLASNEFGNYTNMLQSLAGLGENAAAGVGNAATQTGANAGSSILAGGTAAASGAVGSANAITGSVNNGLSNALLLQALQNPSSYGSLNVNNSGFVNSVNNAGNFSTGGISFTQ